MGKYHFIAIGGIGMSGLAKYLLEDGYDVSGSDIQDSKYIKAIESIGAKVNIGHREENLPDGATVVVSSAIREDNPELKKAKELGFKILHRSDMLKEISDAAKAQGMCFIGFSGTHGKTTTSGLASYVLEKAGLKPSFVDGGILPEINTNAQHKSGKHFIAELDESDGTIIKYSPDILVINNIEEDHLDFYKNGMPDLINTFKTAVSKSGKVIVNKDNNGINLLIKNCSGRQFITFGEKDADYVFKNVQITPEFTNFEILKAGKVIASIKTPLAGIHNIYNILAVVAALYESGIDINKVTEHFSTFTGMGRRFQKVCEKNGILIFDDYAHHPTEIKATLDMASSKFGKENVVAVFQPHRYTRLKSLWNDFKSAFENSGKLIVTDVYAASEDEINGVSGEAFAKEVQNAKYLSGTMEDVAKKLAPELKSGDIVVGLGAGTITALGKYLKDLI